MQAFLHFCKMSGSYLKRNDAFALLNHYRIVYVTGMSLVCVLCFLLDNYAQKCAYAAVVFCMSMQYGFSVLLELADLK